MSKIKKIKFINKVVYLFSGLLISNIISLITFFIAAKIYSLGTLGNYYVFISLGAILNVFASMGYTHCLPVVKNEELKEIFVSVTILSTLTLISISPVVFYFYDYAVLLLIFSLSQFYYSLSQQIFIKDQLIKNLNTVNVGSSLCNMFFTIVNFFLFGDDVFYLIFLMTLSSILINFLVYLKYIRSYAFFNKSKFNLKLLKKYNKFVKYIGPGLILHTIAYQVPTLVAGSFFSPAIAAYYNMAYKLVYLPASLISASVSQVFMGKLSVRSRYQEDLFQDIGKLSFSLILLASIFVVCTFLLLPQIVGFVFGEKWFNSIEISFALLPLVFSLIAISPLTNLFQFTSNQETIFALHLFSLAISLLAFGTAVFLKDFVIGVYIFTTSMLLMYIILALKLKNIASENNQT